MGLCILLRVLSRFVLIYYGVMHPVARIIKVCAYLLWGYASCCAYYQGLCLFIKGLCILLRVLSRFVLIYYGVMHPVARIIKVCAYL
jgi:hypothetical protein